ncbi:MAG TPA: lyase [Gammaproteobacteria bacterium]
MIDKSQALRIVAPAALSFAWLAAPGVGAEEMNPIEIDEWEVPFEGRARDPFAVGPDEVWFVGQRGHYLARFTPSTGEFFKRDLADEPGPHNLIVGSDGIVWYSGNLKGYIGRYDPKTDEIEMIAMPNPAARDPHTLVFDDGEEHIWFTVQGGNFVGRLTVADRSVDLIEVPTPRARPYGIKIAEDGTPWIVLLGTNKLASVDPETLELTEHVIPAEGARPRRLEITSDGRIWYADFARGYLGSYDPKTDEFAEWALPSGEDSRPYGMASDERDRVWVVETGVTPNQFVGFDTRTEQVISVTEIPSGGGSVRHMYYHMPSASIWFGTDEETLARAVVGSE